MQCYKCSRKPIENNLSMIPVGEKGPNRKWVCTECSTAEEINAVPIDVKDICDAINPNFIKK